jgi:hypothetical protein
VFADNEVLPVDSEADLDGQIEALAEAAVAEGVPA